PGDKTELKLLVVIVLVALLLLLLYRRLRPYLKVIRDFLNTLRAFKIHADQDQTQKRQSEKLVCCKTCGTWIPAGRALSAGPGASVGCCTDCLRLGKKRSSV